MFHNFTKVPFIYVLPKASRHFLTVSLISDSSLVLHWSGIALPPLALISSTTEFIEPGNLSVLTTDLDATPTWKVR